MKVLIVEDEALVAMYLAALVVSFGYEVCGLAACATEAIDDAAAQAPHVALMDVRLLHGDSGVDVAREIYVRSGLRCIFLSANLDDATRSAVDSCQPIDFLDKPVLPGLLRRALQKAERLVAD